MAKVSIKTEKAASFRCIFYNKVFNALSTKPSTRCLADATAHTTATSVTKSYQHYTRYTFAKTSVLRM